MAPQGPDRAVPSTAQVYIQPECGAPLELHTVALASPARHQVAVEIRATGLCQSQVTWMNRAENHPELHGHEGFGRVLAVGEGVDGVAAGDPVVLTWIPRRAADGRRPVPSRVDYAGGAAASHNVHTWATHAVVDELYVMPVPEAAASPELALVGCAVPTGAGAVRNSAGVQPGASVAVIGLGGVGLSAVAAARASGAGAVVAVDINDDKLRFAGAFGATDTVDSTVTSLRVASERFRSLAGGPGFDVVIDCVGTAGTVADALGAAASGGIGSHRGGTVVLVGAPKGPLVIDGAALMMAEKSLIGCRGGGAPQETFHEFLRWSAEGALPLRTMVTDTCGFADLPAAVDALAAGEVRGRALVLME